MGCGSRPSSWRSPALEELGGKRGFRERARERGTQGPWLFGVEQRGTRPGKYRRLGSGKERAVRAAWKKIHGQVTSGEGGQGEQWEY